MAGKDTVKILGDLNKSYPFPQTEADRRLHEALGVDNERITARAEAYIAAQKELARYLEQEKGMHAWLLTLKPKSAVRKAVIPVAGFGTRLYPETRGVKKEFCPVVDRDGLVKPAILVLLEELDAVEIEEICLVINREERQLYEDYFFKPLSEEHVRKLPKQMRAYEDKIRRIAGKLKFQVQEEQLGFGHAVYQCRDFAAGEPVMLLLGDTIYQSNSGVPCTAQLLEAYRRYGLSMVALHKIALDQVMHYGIFAGTWENKEQTVMQIMQIAEKPKPEYAKDFLSVPDVSAPENYYAAFGAYILTQEVFERLGEMVSAHAPDDGEIRLTDALAYVREHSGMMGVVPDGESFDIGNAEAYRDTVSRFGK